MKYRVLIALSLLALLPACSGNDKKIDPPADLVKFNATARVDRVWGAGVGGDKPKLRLGLGVAVDQGRVFAAGHNGDVVAFDLKTGKQVWRVRTRTQLAGGPGAGGGLVAVGASYGDVVALDAATGGLKWKVRVNSEVLAAPAVSADAVVVRSVDGHLHGLAPADGHELWNVEQQVPRLTLRGTASPVITGELVICGFDNGKVVAVNIKDGASVWESQIAPPSGRTELQRLNDVDSAVRVVEEDVYVVSFQGRVARLGKENGQLWWSREMSSYRGLDIDEDGVYVSTAEGEVVKIGRRTGVELWRQKMLKNRRLSAPVVLGNEVAVADFDGYVHFLDIATGDFVARSRAGGGHVITPPMFVDGLVLLMNDEGHLTAFRVTPRVARAGSPPPAAAPPTAPPSG